MTPKDTKENKTISRAGRTLSGVVVSSKMKDTVVVTVSRFIKDPRYGKYLTLKKRYKAHDPGNTKKEGEQISIKECRPISKEKHFRVV